MLPLADLEKLKHVFVEENRVHKLMHFLGRNGIVKTAPWLKADRKPRIRRPKA